MKRVAIYLLAIIFISFIIPILFTRKFEFQETVSKINENDSSNENIEETNENYDYKQYSTIKLYHAKTTQIEDLPLDEYLLGVVSAEMPASYEQEALKAQAVVARTYTIYKIKNQEGKHGEASICDDSTCCQAWISKEERLSKWDDMTKQEYWGKIETAVNETKGKIITYNGEPINAFFHSNSGGNTENPSEVWGGTGYAYLQSVETSGEVNYNQYKSEAIFTKDEFIKKIKEKHQDFQINFDEPNCIEILEYTTGGRIKQIRIGNISLSGVEVRTIFGIKSAKFEIFIENENIKFSVTGYGHGVGMSQTGADSLAKEGKNFEDIIKHYYTNVEIIDI